MFIKLETSFILLVLFLLFSMSYGASLSNSDATGTGGVNFPRETADRENGTSFIKVTSYLASNFWQKVSSEVENGWQKTVAYAKIIANETVNNYEKMSSGTQNSILPNEKDTSRQTKILPITSVHTNHSTARNPFTRKFQQQESLSPTNSTAHPVVSEYQCKTFDCMVWKISKVMGISLGGGFLASLALPVAAYIILHIIGLTGYGIALGCSACRCQSINKEGNVIVTENWFSCLMQSIAGSTLKTMYSFCPILLLWLSCGSLIGWFIWPYF